MHITPITNTIMTPVQALDSALADAKAGDMQGVLIIAYNSTDDFYIRSSTVGHDKLFLMADKAMRWAKSIEQNGDRTMTERFEVRQFQGELAEMRAEIEYEAATRPGEGPKFERLMMLASEYIKLAIDALEEACAEIRLGP